MRPHKCCNEHPTIAESHVAMDLKPEKVSIFCESCLREVVAVTAEGAINEWNKGCVQ